jgi:nucleoside-diphosphate-sugar epimerase
MRALILGGTGFLGRPIARLLVAAGADVTVFHRPPPGCARPQAAGPGQDADLPTGVRVVHGDRNALERSAEEFRRIAPEVVVDTIAFTERQAEALMNTFRDIARRVVILSSGDVYRANDILFARVAGSVEPTPLTESSPLRGRLFPYRGMSMPTAYDIDLGDYDKILVERIVSRDPKLPATILRLPMVYGPGDEDGRKRRFMPYLKRMDDGRAAILLDRRTAQWRAPWGYVEDIADAVRLCVEKEKAAGQIYNVGESDRMDMEQWVRELAAVAGWTGRLVLADEPCPPPSLPRALNLDQHLDMATTRIREELGYRETVSRREALRRTVMWDRAHPPAHLDASQFDYSAEDEILSRRR